jgi:gamma-glutamylcyclotransferase (GGCT)/AIG2-like uncharacterized protein YtfP
LKLFVYGTLKSDGELFLFEHAKNIRPAQIRGDLYEHPNAWFPFADVSGEGVITGEVHEYDPLVVRDTIDFIENGYTRVKTQTLEGEEVWVYSFPQSSASMKKIESGIWEN